MYKIDKKYEILRNTKYSGFTVTMGTACCRLPKLKDMDGKKVLELIELFHDFLEVVRVDKRYMQ